MTQEMHVTIQFRTDIILTYFPKTQELKHGEHITELQLSWVLKICRVYIYCCPRWSSD